MKAHRKESRESSQTRRPHLKVVGQGGQPRMSGNEPKEGPVPAADRDNPMTMNPKAKKEDKYVKMKPSTMMEKAEGDEDIVDEALRNTDTASRKTRAA